jgi:ketosteroid isomerase-like protein
MQESPGFYEQVGGAANSGSELVSSRLRWQWKKFALDWQSDLATPLTRLLKRFMKRILVITAVIISAWCNTEAQSKGEKKKSIEQELMQLQRATEEAEDKKDLTTLARLLTDDYIFTAPGGTVTDKKKLIEEVQNNVSDEPQTISYEDVKSQVYGKAAVVNYLLIGKGRDKDGKDTISRYRNTVGWVKQQGRWRMAAIHVSRIKP